MLLKLLATLTAICTLSGCCYMSRNLCKELPPGRGLTSDYYVTYTNGVTKTQGTYTYDVYPHYYVSSYVGGPYKGAILYPATRNVLNILSGWSYSSAASGNYMLNLITLPTYPIYIVELPIQTVLDTVLIPFDLINTPNPPEGYSRKL